MLAGTALITYSGCVHPRESERGYYAFGSDRRVVGTPATDHRFTGQKVDGTGLYYYNARYYDPVIGQFVSPDTIVPEPNQVFAYNRYMYVLGNPLRYNDPTGHCATLDDGSEDRETDGRCWQLSDFILRSWQDDPAYWDPIVVSEANWTTNIAPNLDEAWMEGQIVNYANSDQFKASARAHGPNSRVGEVQTFSACEFWDCPAIILDFASLGLSVAQTGAAACAATGVGAPVCGSGAAYLTAADVTLNVAAVGYEMGQYTKGGGTAYDLSTTLADNVVKPAFRALGIGASVTPGVGIVYDMGMLLYDVMIDPFVSTPGAPVGVK